MPAAEAAQCRRHLSAGRRDFSIRPSGSHVSLPPMGFSGIRLRIRPFQALSASGFFNSLEKSLFSKNNQLRGVSKNKCGTRAYQALEGGDDASREIAQKRSRMPEFEHCPIAAGWDGVFPGSAEIAIFRTKSEQNQVRFSRGIFESRLFTEWPLERPSDARQRRPHDAA
jgi:hypothetical protein